MPDDALVTVRKYQVPQFICSVIPLTGPEEVMADSEKKL